MANPINSLASVETLTIAGRQFADPANLIILGGLVGGSGADCTFRLSNNASAGYQVTSGKTYKIEAITAVVFTSGAFTGNFGLLYSDNDVGFDSGTNFTNPVYEYEPSNTPNTLPYLVVQAASGASNFFQSAFNSAFNVPATKYPGITMGTGNPIVAKVYGYET